jgi:hypothetical protein
MASHSNRSCLTPRPSFSNRRIWDVLGVILLSYAQVFYGGLPDVDSRRSRTIRTDKQPPVRLFDKQLVDQNQWLVWVIESR